jgi:hypothetical protein
MPCDKMKLRRQSFLNHDRTDASGIIGPTKIEEHLTKTAFFWRSSRHPTCSRIFKGYPMISTVIGAAFSSSSLAELEKQYDGLKRAVRTPIRPTHE